MKKILVFIDWYKPGYKAGGPIRSISNMVEHLSGNYEFYIVTRNTDYLESKPYSEIEPDKWVKLAENENVYYISNKNLSVNQIRKLILLTPFDIAYVNGVYSFYFSVLPVFILRNLKSKRIIVAPRGMLSRQTFKAKVLKKRIFILFIRFFGLYKNSIFHTTSMDEKIDIQNLKINPGNICQISNLPPVVKEIKTSSIEKTVGKLKLVSLARISNEKNTLFALQCLQNFSYKGSIVFDLYGSVYQTEYWEKCKEVISKLPDNIQVNYLNEIDNSQVYNILQNYHFLFMPSLGENFGHSILESFISGHPVIISDKTPWRNLHEKGLGWDLDLNDAQSFANAIQQAIDFNNQSYNELSEKCLKFAANYLDNQEIKKEYCQLFG